MAKRNDVGGLLASWRALAGMDQTAGWRIVSIFASRAAQVHVGRRFPGNEEALLVYFPGLEGTGLESFPHGNGFDVSKVDPGTGGPQGYWLAVQRLPEGDLKLFATMAADLASLVETSNLDALALLRHLVSRISAWQEFMGRGGAGALGPEPELGMVGELEVLSALLDRGVAPHTAVGAWQGPLDGVQDFVFGVSALEVKSTVSSTGFTIKIGSLEQLDDSLARPLVLVANKYSLDETGATLVERVHALRGFMAEYADARAEFENRLLRGGVLDEHASQYTRRFRLESSEAFVVADEFPRLARSAVPPAIKSARYEIELSSVRDKRIKLGDAFALIGAVQ